MGTWVLRWQYVPGSSTHKGQTHAQSRGDVWRGLDWFVKDIRTRYGFDIAHKHVEGGKRVTISFGVKELHLGNGLYGLGVVKSNNRNRIWLLGGPNKRFATAKIMGYTVAHEFLHTVSYKSNPAADKYGHSVDRNDVFNAGVGYGLTTTATWWQSLGGMIPGWKPGKAAAQIELPMDMGGQIVCGCQD